jgi:uncharacterized membrane protein YfcA
MDLDLIELSLVSGIMLIGSASQAAIGMGLNLFAIPLLLLINPLYAPGPVLFASLLLSVLALWRVPSAVDWTELRFALFGLVAGTVVAAVVVASVDSSDLMRFLGLFIIVGVGLAFSGWSAVLNKRNLVLAGSCAGFLGTVAGVHGPPIALLYQGLSAVRVRGALLTFMGLGNGFSIVALALVDRFGKEQILATLLLMPGVLAGLWLAPLLAKRISTPVLRTLVLSVSAVSGLALVLG